MTYFTRTLPILGALVFTLALAACSTLPQPLAPSTAAPPTASADDLLGIDWRLELLNGAAPVPGTTITLKFEDGRAGGHSGCNSYGGEYTAGGGQVALSEVAMTLMACMDPDGVMEQESAYLDTLSTAAAYRVTGDRLEIDNDAGVTVLVFTGQAHPAMNPDELVGTAWALETDPVFTISFDSPTSLSGRTSCRGYRADYQADPASFRLTFMEMQGLGCLQPESALLQEGDYTTQLGWVSRYELNAGQLTLHTSRGETLIFTALPAAAPAPAEQIWYLVSFLDVDGAAPVLAGTQITLNAGDGAIQAAGGFSGSAGCNSYNAGYAYDGARFTFGPIATTRMFCAEPEGVMDQEQKYAAWLQEVTGFRFDADQLRLETDDGRALLFNTAPIAPADPGMPAPPPAALTIGDQTQTAGLGSYCWADTSNAGPAPGLCVDKFGVPTPAEPLRLPAAPFTARFDLGLEAAPTQLLLRVMPAVTEYTGPDGLRYWEPGPGDDYPLPLAQSSQVDLTLAPGLYLLHIFAVWDTLGDASYGFLVHVQ